MGGRLLRLYRELGLYLDTGVGCTHEEYLSRWLERLQMMIYTRLDVTGTGQVMSVAVNMLFRDRRTLCAYTSAHGDRAGEMSEERLWGFSSDGVASDLAHGWVISLAPQDRPQDAGRDERVRAADSTRSRDYSDPDCWTDILQERDEFHSRGLVTTLQGQGPTGGPAPPELPEEAGSSS
ncbi:hypothetical protein Tco_1501955 [Tanacetum coccineum]